MPLASNPKVRGSRYLTPLEIAAHDLEVDRIETCGMNPDPHILVTGDRIGDVGQPHIVRDRAIAAEEKGPHGSPLPG
jgi:hypothetical protein